MAKVPIHVAIVGGGLCGLALAIALTKRSIAHTIYESQNSFTEIGAGINLGPNTIEAFRLIDPEIGDEIFSFATRNPGRNENLWMKVRLGAATKNFEDAALIHEISTLPSKTGCMTVGRNELLQFLAKRIQAGNARFNKKLVDLHETEAGVTMSFEDGSSAMADVVIACDGIHSTARRLLCGAGNPAAKAKFTGSGAYRAVFPMDEFEQLVGKDQSQISTIRIGPGGYVITYPIDGGKNMNVGLWGHRPGGWQHEEWTIPRQKEQMYRDMEGWGPTVHKIMDAMNDNTAFWATHAHTVTPEKYHKGRICIIGDAAHASAPHQGQGASQAMEDSCAMATVLHAIESESSISLPKQTEAAFAAFEAVRRPRFEKVMHTSNEAMYFWGGFWKADISSDDVKAFKKASDERFPWMWQADIAGQCKRALGEMGRLLTSNGSV